MRIHSDILTSLDVYEATKTHGMTGVDADVRAKGSRSRKRRLDVTLSGTSTRRPNPGTGHRETGGQAATWDEWGMFLDALFQKDPDAIAGPYKGQEHFRTVTQSRYTELTHPYQHPRHKWERDLSTMLMECTGCEAEWDTLATYQH